MFDKPRPLPTEDSEPYWDACHEGRLCVSKCPECAHMFLPPASMCPACWCEDAKLEQVSGRGVVFSWIVVHRPQHPSFFADAPYNVAIIELDEGPRMHSRIVGIEPDAISVGMAVRVDFEKLDDEISLPVFKPVE